MPFCPDDRDPLFPKRKCFSSCVVHTRQVLRSQWGIKLQTDGLQKHRRVGRDDLIQLCLKTLAQRLIVGKLALDGKAGRDP